MGLTNCPECSREVSDRAASCPQCGSPITAESVTLTLTGIPRRILGAKPVHVYLNGSKVGSVGKAEELTLTLPSGGNVEFVTQAPIFPVGRLEKRVSFNVPGGTEANLSFDIGPLGGLNVVDRNADSGVMGVMGFVGFGMDL